MPKSQLPVQTCQIPQICLYGHGRGELNATADWAESLEADFGTT